MSDVETPKDTPGPPEPGPEEPGRDIPLPPASFEFLVLSFRTQVELNLGLYPVEGDHPPPMDARLARHFIDMLAMLQEKTRGNLELAEQRLLDNTLTELRFRYLQRLSETKQG